MFRCFRYQHQAWYLEYTMRQRGLPQIRQFLLDLRAVHLPHRRQQLGSVLPGPLLHCWVFSIPTILPDGAEKRFARLPVWLTMRTAGQCHL